MAVTPFSQLYDPAQTGPVSLTDARDTHQAIADSKLTAVDTIAALTALAKASLTDGDRIIVSDGETGGIFTWNENSTATADGGTVLASDEGGDGRWLREYSGPLYSSWFGTAADGAGGTDNTSALQAAFDAVENGKLIIPAGDYEVTSLLDFSNKNAANDSDQKNVAIEAYGAVLHFSSVAAGQTCIRFNDCKYTHVAGLEVRSANGGRIELDGFWRGSMRDVKAGQLTLEFAPNDLGSFDSQYWNHFDNCHFKGLVFDTGAGGVDSTETNGNIFTSCIIAPRPEMGETGEDYAIVVRGTGAIQDNTFLSCDISYYTTGMISVDDTLASGSFDFQGCYFDSSGALIPNDTKNLRVNFLGTNMAANSPSGDRARLVEGSRQTINLFGGARNGSRVPIGSYNLVKNGDGSLGADSIVLSAGGANITATPTSGDGLFGQFIKIATSFNRSASWETMPVPFDGYYTFTVIARNLGDDIRTVYQRNGSSVAFDAVDIESDGEWCVASFTTPAISQGDVLAITFFGASTYNLEYDVAYVGCTFGSTGQLMAPAHPDAGSASTQTYFGLSDVPSAPSEGRFRRFVDDIGFAWLQDENGRLRIDNAVGSGSVRQSYAIASGLATSDIGASAGTSHGTATAQGISSSNYFTRKARQNNVSAAATGENCGKTFGQFAYLSDPGRVRIIAGWETFASGAAALIGIATSGALGNADPSARTNFIGLALNSGDVNWSLMHNDGGGSAVEIALGVNFPANTSATDLYEITLWWPAGAATVHYQVVRLNDPQYVAQGQISSDLPSTVNTYGLHVLGNTRTGSSAIGLSWSSVYAETI